MQVLFFDGGCVLCNSAALWVAKRNRPQNLHFASLQGEFAQKNLTNLPPETDSLVFLDNSKLYIKSEAIFELIKHLPNYRWLKFLRIFPLNFRDWIYDLIAKNRIKWFGKAEVCRLPNTEFRSRFLA